ncbi:MAG: O-antigen ligase family protein [Phycisphaerales bacterium]
MMVLLAGLLFFGLTFTSSPNYGWAKSSRYFVFGSIMFLSPILFLRNNWDIKMMVWTFVIVGLMIGIATILNIQGTQERASFLEADDIGTAVKISIGTLIAFCFIINKHSSKISKIAYGIIVFVCFVGIVLTGSRGPLFGLIICFAIAPFLFGRRVSLYWLIPGLAVGILGFGYSMIKAEREASSSFRRISALWEHGDGVEEAFGSRMPLYTYAISNIPKKPLLGHGTGAFAVDFEGVDERKYPHNIFLELGYENGIPGIIIFVVFLILIYRKWKESRFYSHQLNNEELYNLSSIAGLIFIYFFLQVMKSGDLDGNQFLFFCSGFILAINNATSNYMQKNELYFNDNTQIEQ